MRLSLTLLSLCLRAVSSSPTTTTEENSRVLSGVYIAEFADGVADATDFYSSLAAGGINVIPRVDLTFRFFKGVSFQVQESSTLAGNGSLLRQLQSIREIRNVWPVRISQPMQRDAAQPTNAATSGSQTARRKRQSSETLEPPFSPHVMTQIDKLHQEGVYGKGFQVAVIDSGVDYTHPALGGCFGPGCIVDKGYDFVGDDFRAGTVPPTPDDDPMDSCFGHGTHVAGIVAAQLKGNKYHFNGAAPGVNIAAYRIWNCFSGTTDEIQLAAFARAVDDGADIISYSNGFASGWSEHVLAIVASRIAESGIPFIVSEGNNGGFGLFSLLSPASGKDVTGTGAVTNTHFPTLLQRGNFTDMSGATDANATHFGVLMGEPAFETDVTLPLWSAVEFNNACQPLPNGTDLSGRIVLLQFPDSKATGCYPPDQGNNIAAQGGRYMLYYEQSNLTMRDQPFVYANGIEGVARVPPYQAGSWLTELTQGSTILVSVPNANSTDIYLEDLEDNETGGYLSSAFTSWGPSWELNLTPHVVAPGENILSTYPTAMGSYVVLAGTSMAAPLVAGIYALLGQVYGKLDTNRMRRILTSTSKPLPWYDGTRLHEDMLAPVPQQGGGLIQAWNAAHVRAELDSDGILFNDTEHFNGEHTIHVSNTGGEEMVVELSHRAAVTMYTLSEYNGALQSAPFPNPIVDDAASMQFSASTLTIPAGASVPVTVTGIPPAKANTTLLPVYSGFIQFESRGGNTSLVLPYLGVAGSMRSTPILVPSLSYLADFNIPAAGNTTYTMARPDPSNPADPTRGDQGATPNVYLGLSMGTRELHVDVVGSNGTVVGGVYGSPQVYVPNTSTRIFFHGLMADATVLPEGSYAFRVKALRVFGNAANEDDWDVVTTVDWVLKYT